MTIFPHSEEFERGKRIRDRSAAVELAVVQAELLAGEFGGRGEVRHSLYYRFVQTVLRIGKHLKLTDDQMVDFEKKMRDAGVKDTTVIVTGKTVYIEGHFDLAKLRKGVIW
jgi:hypothetical protein